MLKMILCFLWIFGALCATEEYTSISSKEMQQTLAIIKPDAVAKRKVGHILERYENEGFQIVGLKMAHLSKEDAENFYAIHKDRPFYKGLVHFMSSGPIVIAVLKAPNAIQRHRALIGATDPSKAAPGTIRKDFATNVQENAVHGSDSENAAKEEIQFFFKPYEIISLEK